MRCSSPSLSQAPSLTHVEDDGEEDGVGDDGDGVRGRLGQEVGRRLVRARRALAQRQHALLGGGGRVGEGNGARKA